MLDLADKPLISRTQTSHLPAVMLLVATVAWGFGFTWAKEAQSAINERAGLPAGAGFGPLVLLAARFLASSLILVIAIPACRSGWTRTGILRACILGAMLGLGMILQHLGLDRTSEAVSAFLTSLTILFVPILMTVMLRRPPRALFWLAVAIATAGVWLMTGATPQGFGVGELLGLSCAIVYSFYLIVVNAIIPRETPWRMTLGMFVVAGILALLTCLFIDRPESLSRVRDAAADSRVGLNFALLVIFPTIGSYALMNLYQPMLDPTRAALIYLMEPIFASLYAWIAVDRALEPVAIAGAVLIIAANALVELLPSRR